MAKSFSMESLNAAQRKAVQTLQGARADPGRGRNG